MSFGRRVTVSVAAAVAVAVVLASLASYLIVRHEFGHAIDKSLERSLLVDRQIVHGQRFPHGHGLGRTFASPPGGVTGARRFPRPRRSSSPSQRLNYLLVGGLPNRLGEPGLVQLITATGVVRPAFGVVHELPATNAVEALARAGRGSFLFDTHLGGSDVRVLAAGIEPGVAVEIDRSISEQEATLANLRLILLIVAAIGIALATLLGSLVARTTLAPVRRLTAAAEHVAATIDLDQRIDEGRRDELGRLARSFNAMLEALDGTIRALDQSARAQRQLIADASHELRTPVTSVRTNLEILQRSDDLAPPERARLITDVVGQLEELSELVVDLIELARDDEHDEPLEDVRMDILVDEAIERTKLHSPQARFEVALEETLVSAVPSRLGRAVNNLLENAVKFAGTDEPIEVRLHDGELEIRDHGPGIDPDELPHIFDRFFRGSRSRSLPGSGLGLAIVRQVVERHAGTVTAGPAPGGGTLVRLRLPLAT
ncbi:MAG: HAMP domain-containing sensor histidine kinase [Solirubrobacteraceae bacterium]